MQQWIAIPAALLLMAGATPAQERPGDTVTFELKNSIIFVQGTINGAGPFTFIFDTGASVTVLRPQTAAKLGLTEKKAEDSWTGWLSGLLGGAQVATVDSIGLGKALVRQLPVAVMVVPQADLPLKLQGITYDGIVGYNYISQFVTTIDYKLKTIRLVPNDYAPEDPLAAMATKKAAPAAPQNVPYVGLAYRALPEEGGIEVRAVAVGSPADKAGIQPGDILRELNGAPVRNAETYKKALVALKPGEAAAFALMRDKKTITLRVTCGERP